MNRTQILIFALSLALVSAAFIGGTSASAVTLCMTEGNESKTCPEGKRYLAREYKAFLEPETVAILQGEGYNTLCETLNVTAKTTKKEGNPLPGEITNMVFGSCEGCTTVKALNLPYGINITSSGDGKKDGDMKVVKQSGVPTVELTGCAGGLATCIFGAANEKVDLELIGGLTGEIHAVLEPFQYVGGSGEIVCKKAAKFTATFYLTEPAAVWVTAFP